eukprot:1158421-Pelagomonas_calceolata.AAC.14
MSKNRKNRKSNREPYSNMGQTLSELCIAQLEHDDSSPAAVSDSDSRLLIQNRLHAAGLSPRANKG